MLPLSPLPQWGPWRGAACRAPSGPTTASFSALVRGWKEEVRGTFEALLAADIAAEEDSEEREREEQRELRASAAAAAAAVAAAYL